MNEQELMKLARENGYYLVKKRTRKTKLLPCRCGAKQMHIHRQLHACSVYCHKCGLNTPWMSDLHRTKFEAEEAARKYWNEMMQGGIK